MGFKMKDFPYELHRDIFAVSSLPATVADQETISISLWSTCASP
jgi:hypothetical protein